MSEYKWGDPEGWDTFCYVEKGSEKLGFFQTYLELKNLERQLEEAREVIKETVEHLKWRDEIQDGLGTLEPFYEKLKEQLKEKDK